MPRRYRSSRSQRSKRSYGGGTKKRSQRGGRSSFFRKSSRNRTAGWHWLLTGVLVGTVVTGMLYLNEHPLNAWHSSMTAKVNAPTQTQVATAKPTYEFYRLLSKPTHQANDIQSDSERMVSAQPTPQLSTHKKVQANRAQLPSVLSSSLGQCQLQLASFPSRDGAKRMQRQLRDGGYVAVIARAKINGKTWFRVMSKRLKSEQEALSQQAVLKQQGIIASLIHMNG